MIYPAEKRLRGAPFIPDSAHAKDTKARSEMAGFFLLKTLYLQLVLNTPFIGVYPHTKDTRIFYVHSFRTSIYMGLL